MRLDFYWFACWLRVAISKYLRCVVCHKGISRDTTHFESGTIKTLAIKRGIGRNSMHGNRWYKTSVQEFDLNGRLVAETNDEYITTYKNFGRIRLKTARTTYRLNSDSISREVKIYRKGRLSKIKVVER